MFSQDTRVLVIDDMMTMRKIVGRACKQLGFTDIIEAKDGVHGWEQLNSSEVKVGLVISDWNMPNCSGLDLLKRVRSSQKYSPVPFVLLTAESEMTQVREAMSVGVDNYIVKPFNQETFEQKIKQVYDKYYSKVG